jgi:hypothetical protein
MEQALVHANIHERTVACNALDHACEAVADLELGKCFLAPFALLLLALAAYLFVRQTVGRDRLAPLMVKVDDF